MSIQLERARKKEAQAKAYRQKLESAEKTRERKKDVRRKILLGAYVLERLKAKDARAESFRLELDGYLTRDNDRALFELPPLPKAEEERAVKKALAETA